MNYNIQLDIVQYLDYTEKIKVLSYIFSDDDFKFALDNKIYGTKLYYFRETPSGHECSIDEDKINYLPHCKLEDLGKNKWNIFMEYCLRYNKQYIILYAIEHNRQDMIDYINMHINHKDIVCCLAKTVIFYTNVHDTEKVYAMLEKFNCDRIDFYIQIIKTMEKLEYFNRNNYYNSSEFDRNNSYQFDRYKNILHYCMEEDPISLKDTDNIILLLNNRWSYTFIEYCGITKYDLINIPRDNGLNLLTEILFRNILFIYEYINVLNITVDDLSSSDLKKILKECWNYDVSINPNGRYAPWKGYYEDMKISEAVIRKLGGMSNIMEYI